MNNPVNLLINASRIKYDVLSELFKDVNIKDKKVNIFIDLYSIVYRLFKDNTASTISGIAGSEYEIVVSMTVAIMNTIGHYRKFISISGYDNRVFLVFNPSAPDFQSHKVDNYGEKYYSKFAEDNVKFSQITKMLMKSLEFVKTLSQYIEDVFYIPCDGVEEFVAMKFIMDCDQAKDDFNIIISKNDLMYQLLNKNTIILYPKRDNSYIITKNNWYDRILGDVKYKTSSSIPTIYVPIFLTLAGIKSRKMRFGYNRGVVSVMRMIDIVNKEYPLKNISINVFLKRYFDSESHKQYEITEDDMKQINEMFSAIHLDSCLASLFDYQRNNILSNIYNIFDRDSLEELNSSLVGEYDIIDLNALERNFGFRGGR